MNKKFTFKRLVVSIIMIFSATLMMNAQDQVNPWHLVVNEGKPVNDHFSVEIVTDVYKTSPDSATVFLNNGSTYRYPLPVEFGFKQLEGNGTAIANINAPKWNVYYGNGNLTHFAAHQVTNLCKSSTSIFTNSDLCTTNFCFVKG